MASGHATVKAVLSGDTIVLVGKATGSGPPQEITITLASIQAPRISRGPQQSSEDPFGWESREFLRKLCIGKSVNFRVIYVVTSIGRTFGDVFLQPPAGSSEEPQNLAKLVVAAGWVAVKSADASDDKVSASHDELLALENSAKAVKLGVHTDSAPARAKAIRKINWSPTSAEVEEIFNKHKGVPTNVVVEFVRDGSSLRVVLLDTMTYISFSFAGIICPRINTKASSEGETAQPEPFAQQARHFTELRFLNREMQVVMQSVDRGGNVLGTALHPKGNIAVELVRSGLARVAERSLPLVTKDTAQALRAAEKEAQGAHRFIWVDYVPPKPHPSRRVFEGLVLEVISGDTLVVLEDSPTDPDGIERRITLSSVRIPRLGNQRGGSDGSAPTGAEPWAVEGRDLLRARLIGRRVTVSVEYERGGKGDGDDATRTFATVKYQGRNVAVLMIGEGLATATKHRADEERSDEYDQLLLAEADAVNKKKAQHGTAPPPPATRINDLTNDSKKAKAFIALLLQRGRGTVHKGTVEFVYSGSRVKVYIPSEGCTLQVTLGQVRCPLLGRSASGTMQARASEPFAEEARKLTRRTLMQRPVEVVIDDVDKNGVALGRIYFPAPPAPPPAAAGGDAGGADLLSTVFASSGWKSAVGGSSGFVPYAVYLVQAGLARIDKFAVERESSSASEIAALQQTQAAAKEAKRGLWLTYVEEEPKQVVENDEEADGEGAGDAVTDTAAATNSTSSSSSSAASNARITAALRGSEEKLVVRVSEISNGTTFYVHILGLGKGTKAEVVDAGNSKHQKQLETVHKLMADFATTQITTATAAIAAATAAAATTASGEDDNNVAANGSGTKSGIIKKGKNVLALFDDGAGAGPCWFRAKIEDTVGEDRIKVLFIDYGNRAILDLNEVAIVDSSSSSGGTNYFAIAPLAVECRLAFLSPPSESLDPQAYGDGHSTLAQLAGHFLSGLSWDKDLVLQVLGKDGQTGPLIVALYESAEEEEEEEEEESPKTDDDGAAFPVQAVDPATKGLAARVSIGEQVVQEGLAKVSRAGIRSLTGRGSGPAGRPANRGHGGRNTNSTNNNSGGGGGGRGGGLSQLATILLDRLEEAQRDAHRAHVNLFRYGDAPDSDDERDRDRDNREQPARSSEKEKPATAATATTTASKK